MAQFAAAATIGLRSARLTAHYRPENQIRFEGDFAAWSGLEFENAKGRLHGTPTQPGLLQAAWDRE
jgi:hypothetical protein